MTDNRTTELLPCPFCGGEAETHETIDGWIAACSSEQSELDGFTHKAQAYGTTEAVAIAAWNTRAPVENDGWFYLPKPKESIVQYGEQRTEKTEHGYKVTQPVEVIEGAIRSWSDELGEYIMKRICEAWNTRTHGTLTAEQVREAVMSADRWEKPMGNTGMTNTHLIIRDDGWQAIADELNARAERTCHNTHENRWFKCSACGYGFTDLYAEDESDINEQPRYCPNCGCKAVDA